MQQLAPATPLPGLPYASLHLLPAHLPLSPIGSRTLLPVIASRLSHIIIQEFIVRN